MLSNFSAKTPKKEVDIANFLQLKRHRIWLCCWHWWQALGLVLIARTGHINFIHFIILQRPINYDLFSMSNGLHDSSVGCKLSLISDISLPVSVTFYQSPDTSLFKVVISFQSTCIGHLISVNLYVSTRLSYFSHCVSVTLYHSTYISHLTCQFIKVTLFTNLYQSAFISQ